jgi:hypothetical protein
MDDGVPVIVPTSDADFHFRKSERPWDHNALRSGCWERIQQFERRAYRVLLTRARQGMVIFVPHGASDDHAGAASVL